MFVKHKYIFIEILIILFLIIFFKQIEIILNKNEKYKDGDNKVDPISSSNKSVIDLINHTRLYKRTKS